MHVSKSNAGTRGGTTHYKLARYWVHPRRNWPTEDCGGCGETSRARVRSANARPRWPFQSRNNPQRGRVGFFMTANRLPSQERYMALASRCDQLAATARTEGDRKDYLQRASV